MNDIIHCLEENPIIAALSHTELFEEVTDSKVSVVFLLSSNILEIEDIVKRLKDKGKKVFVNVDLIDELRKNQAAIDYVRYRINPDGILTSRKNLLKDG